MSKFREYSVSEKALADARRLGVTEPKLTTYLKRIARAAAPITHEDGDWRYDDFVLDIDDTTILGVYPL